MSKSRSSDLAFAFDSSRPRKLLRQQLTSERGGEAREPMSRGLSRLSWRAPALKGDGVRCRVNLAYPRTVG